MKVVKFSALCNSRLYPKQSFGTHFCYRLSGPKGHYMRTERQGRSKSPNDPPPPPGIEPATACLVVHCLNQLRHRSALITLTVSISVLVSRCVITVIKTVLLW
jgi:hypothetical protein